MKAIKIVQFKQRMVIQKNLKTFLPRFPTYFTETNQILFDAFELRLSIQTNISVLRILYIFPGVLEFRLNFVVTLDNRCTTSIPRPSQLLSENTLKRKKNFSLYHTSTSPLSYN